MLSSKCHNPLIDRRGVSAVAVGSLLLLVQVMVHLNTSTEQMERRWKLIKH